MLPLHRLVHLIETRSQDLAADLVRQTKVSPSTPDYKNVPDEELRDRVYEIYRHLGDWLLAKDERQVERRYQRIGAERAAQNVPFSQVAWVIVLTKKNLWEFLKKETEGQNPEKPRETLALLLLLDQFFDQALCSAAAGHEQHKAEPR